MHRSRTLGALALPIAVALIAWSCERAAPVSPTSDALSFSKKGEEKCPSAKFTGGGRIDPPDHQDTEDQHNSQTGPQISGKVTYGFNVFLASDADGNCIVTKGEIQVVHHQPLYPFQVTWHIAIHNRQNSYDGSPVPARTYVTSRGGLCVIVGTTVARMRAVTLGQEALERARLTACDNGEPGSSPGYGPDAFRWESENFGDTQLQYLTGGNIQAH